VRDDIDKLPLPKSAKKYARMTSKDLGSNWSKKVDMYMDMAADVTNQADRKQGFKNKDASGKVKHAFKEGLLGPDDMEQMSSSVETEHRYNQLVRVFENYFHGSDNLDAIEAWMDVFRAATGQEDAPSLEGEMWENAEFVSDRGYAAAEGTMTLEDAWTDCVPFIQQTLTGPYDQEAARRLFELIYSGGNGAHIWEFTRDDSEDEEDPLAESIVNALLEGNDDLLSQMGKVAVRPQKLYKLSREALNFVFGEDQGMEAAINAALETVGIVDAKTHLGCPLAEYIQIALSDIETGATVDETVDYIRTGIMDAVPDLASGSLWALMKLFTEEAQGIFDSLPEDDEIQQQPENEIDAWDNEGIQQESVKAAAVKCHDGTVVAGPPGASHIACCQMANRQGKTWDDDGLGFVTDDGRFIDRNDAEIEGMKHGQLRPEISDQSMVHATDFAWMEGMDRGYRYVTNCVSCDDVDALNEMMDSAVDVTYEEFVCKVGLPAIFDSGIGYSYYWTPAQAISGGVDYSEVARNRPLTLKKDWHVSYHRSTYQGKPCYFMVHSAIEYVFVKD